MCLVAYLFGGQRLWVALKSSMCVTLLDWLHVCGSQAGQGAQGAVRKTRSRAGGKTQGIRIRVHNASITQACLSIVRMLVYCVLYGVFYELIICGNAIWVACCERRKLWANSKILGILFSEISDSQRTTSSSNKTQTRGATMSSSFSNLSCF